MIVAAVYPLEMVLLLFDPFCSWCRLMVWFCNYDIGQHMKSTGPKVIKLLPCSTQLSTKIFLLINVKMPTIVGILTFISMINTTSEGYRARNFFICRHFSFYEELKFRAQLS